MLRVSVVTTPITPSGSFSVETLTGLTLSWKTELNRSISVMEDGIPGGLQHRHETCCEKGGHCGRRACMVQRWHHRRDVVFRTGGLVYDIDEKYNTETLRNEYPITMFQGGPPHKPFFIAIDN